MGTSKHPRPRDRLQDRQVRAPWDCLSPIHGFSSKHPRGHTAVMSAAFRRVEFTNHWLGKDLELGAMGWARGPETKTEELLQGSARCLGIHSREQKSPILENL